MTSQIPFDTHSKVLINRTKFHVYTASGFGEIKANKGTDRTLYYSIDFLAAVA